MKTKLAAKQFNQILAFVILFLILLNPALVGIALLLMLAGVLYEIIVNQMVKKQM